MTGWENADRGWFTNDDLNLDSAANRRIVASELTFPNVAFGVHRRFAGGVSLSEIALGSAGEWEDELSKATPGDNLILLSLRQVQHQAIAHAGDPTNRRPPVLQPSDHDAVQAFITAGGSELALVSRSSPTPTVVECAFTFVDCRDDRVDWHEQVAERSGRGSEVWLFDAEIVWRDHDRRVLGDEQPEAWNAHHGIYLIDGYAPDERGQVVCGGPY
jgi:hypothetical protein